MLERTAQSGTLDWIGLRAGRRTPLVPTNSVDVSVSGLEGDHSRPGKRAVTLIQGEHLAAIGSFLGRDTVAPDRLRRNLVVSGLNLSSLKGRLISIGTARLRLTTICAPCSRMEEEFGPGGYAAVRGHGGWCAEVETEGRISVGDALIPVSEV